MHRVPCTHFSQGLIGISLGISGVGLLFKTLVRPSLGAFTCEGPRVSSFWKITLIFSLLSKEIRSLFLACMPDHFGCVRLFVTLWTIAHQVPCPWSFPGKNTGVTCHALLQGIFPTQGLNPRLLMSPALTVRFFTTGASYTRYQGYQRRTSCSEGTVGRRQSSADLQCPGLFAAEQTWEF